MKIDEIMKLKVGETVNYSGELIVMRDAAQRKLRELISGSKEIPVYLGGKIIFYAGPAKPLKNFKIGAIGPTTSERMDEFLEMLYDLGVIATIGKGKRTNLAVELCKKYQRVYFISPSGAAAYLSKCVVDAEIVAFNELGPEAIYRIEVKDFPMMVAIDSLGNQIF